MRMGEWRHLDVTLRIDEQIFWFEITVDEVE